MRILKLQFIGKQSPSATSKLLCLSSDAISSQVEHIMSIWFVATARAVDQRKSQHHASWSTQLSNPEILLHLSEASDPVTASVGTGRTQFGARLHPSQWGQRRTGERLICLCSLSNGLPWQRIIMICFEASSKLLIQKPPYNAKRCGETRATRTRPAHGERQPNKRESTSGNQNGKQR